MSAVPFADIRARLAAATPGPWVTFTGRRTGLYEIAIAQSDEAEPGLILGDGTVETAMIGDLHFARDGDFIANAPTDIAWLLAEVDRLREALLLYRAARTPRQADAADAVARAALAPAEGDG